MNQSDKGEVAPVSPEPKKYWCCVPSKETNGHEHTIHCQNSGSSKKWSYFNNFWGELPKREVAPVSPPHEKLCPRCGHSAAGVDGKCSVPGCSCDYSRQIGEVAPVSPEPPRCIPAKCPTCGQWRGLCGDPWHGESQPVSAAKMSETITWVEILCERSCSEDAELDPLEALMKIWKLVRLVQPMSARTEPLQEFLKSVADFVAGYKLAGDEHADSQHNFGIGIACMQILDMNDNQELVAAANKYAAAQSLSAQTPPAKEKE